MCVCVCGFVCVCVCGEGGDAKGMLRVLVVRDSPAAAEEEAGHCAHELRQPRRGHAWGRRGARSPRSRPRVPAVAPPVRWKGASYGQALRGKACKGQAGPETSLAMLAARGGRGRGETGCEGVDVRVGALVGRVVREEQHL